MRVFDNIKHSATTDRDEGVMVFLLDRVVAKEAG
jgi:hypothetical protein